MKADKSAGVKKADKDKVSKLLHGADGVPYKIVYKTKRRYTPGSRRANAYINFCKVYAKQLRSEKPEVTFKEVGTLAGEKWRSMSADEKAVHTLAPVAPVAPVESVVVAPEHLVSDETKEI